MLDRKIAPQEIVAVLKRWDWRLARRNAGLMTAKTPRPLAFNKSEPNLELGESGGILR